MKNFRLLSIILLSVTCTLPSCKKYEDGPVLSLRTKKERLANVWVVESATRNNYDITNDYKDFILTMTKTGDATLQLRIIFGQAEIFLQTDGKWTLEELNQNLRLNFENNDYDRYYEILRLKENELWLREISANADELHLKPR